MIPSKKLGLFEPLALASVALERMTRKPAPQERDLLLEMSISAMALAWTPEEVEEMLLAAERSELD